MTRAALYIRVSTTEQAREGYSLAAQESVLTGYCNARNYEIAHVYRDEGKSGRDIARRPGMQKLLLDAQKQRFDIVLVWKLSRFTRSLIDLCSSCDLLEKHGISLASYSEGFDFSGPVGRLTRNILGVIAQWEREVISSNIKLAAEERARQGKRTTCTILGYDRVGKDDMQVNPEEAEVVRFIFAQYLRCGNMSEVIRRCHTKGYRGKKRKGFKPGAMYAVLTRATYCGYNLFHREPIKGTHPAIIPASTYNKVQRLIEANGTGRPRKYPLIFLEEEPPKP